MPGNAEHLNQTRTHEHDARSVPFSPRRQREQNLNRCQREIQYFNRTAEYELNERPFHLYLCSSHTKVWWLTGYWLHLHSDTPPLGMYVNGYVLMEARSLRGELCLRYHALINVLLNCALNIGRT
ncbi:hypothetical protein SEVIR_2G387950v4 [Setaria viridis]